MKPYTNNLWLQGLATVTLLAAVIMVWQMANPRKSNLERVDEGVSKPGQEAPARPQTKSEDVPKEIAPTEESLAAMPMRGRLDALAAYYEKNGFTAAALLLPAFNGDQEIYQATKLLALLASQKEPKAVFAYLAENDRYLLSDGDVMLALMGASSELFPIEDASRYAAMMPAGGARFQAYNYLSQIMADPVHIDKIPGIMATIKDRGVLSYLERSLPGALLRASSIGDAVRQIEELERYGEFTNRSDFVDAGERLAQEHNYSMEGLAELEALGGNKTSALLQGYIEELVRNGQHTYDLLEYTFQRYRDELDDGALLATVFKRALAADPDVTISRLKDSGIETADLDALITRNFINLTDNHPDKAAEYINAQTNSVVRDNLLSSYGLAQKNIDTNDIRGIESRISDPLVKRSYLLDATVKISSEQPQDVFDYIMSYESPAIKRDLIDVNINYIALHDIDLGIRMAEAIPDFQSRASALYSLLDIAGDNGAQSFKVARSLNKLPTPESQQEPATEPNE